MSAIRLDQASFLGCALESACYGVLTLLSVFTLKTIINKDRKSGPRRPLVVVLVLIWVLSTAHWAINVYRAFQAFTIYPEGAVAFYNTLSLSSYTARNIVYCTLTLLADAFAVYRCYLVWDRKFYMAIIPALLLLGTAAAGYGTTYTFTTVPPGNEIFVAKVVPWITTWISLTLATNLVCTCLIAFRIIRSQMAVRKFLMSSVGQRRSHLLSSLIIIVESAAIYSSALVALIICYLMKTNAQYIMLDISVSSIGLTFTMIIFRASLGVLNDGQSEGGSYASRSIRIPTRPGDLAVNMSRLVEVNSDQYSGATGNPHDEPRLAKKSSDRGFTKSDLSSA
ncbi:hypothetical protein C8R43DRAFT_1200788 [Mycena crocata]|nr:hypothetical protein C8R43DRAFT_1200788 [Mycena crocata]